MKTLKGWSFIFVYRKQTCLETDFKQGFHICEKYTVSELSVKNEGN